MKNLAKIEAFNASELNSLLAPVWESKEIIGEAGIIVGEEGAVSLLGTPVQGSVTVKNIFGDVLYEEGVDYTLDGNKIVRIAGGALPFFAMDDYFRKEPNATVQLKANPEKTDIPFAEERFVYFSEGVDCFEKYITVSYRVETPISSGLIQGDSSLQGFVQALKEKKKIKIKLYGDSITVGCNATGTVYGSNVSPYTPSWNGLMKMYLEKTYGAEIAIENHAVGGWSSVNGIDSFDEKCSEGLAETDLFCIGFGANDLFTTPEHFEKNISGMLDKYFAANPNGNALLYSTLLPNAQLTGWRVNQPLFEEVLISLAARDERVGVATVSKVFSVFEEKGKPTRDWLANSVNHPNDFGVRVYAQTLLKTILGEEFL